MRRYLNNPFRDVRTARGGRRAPRRVTLQVDGLEDRMVPSASSFNMHSVVEATGRTVAVYHEFDNVNAPMFELPGLDDWQVIAPAGAVTDFSVGLDPIGHTAVFAHMNGVMQEWTQSTGWISLNQPVAMASFAAVQNGDLYAVATNQSLWQYTPFVYHPTTWIVGGHVYHGGYYTGGWKELLGPNTFIAVDAVTSHGQDIVVGMNANRQLSWYLPSTGYRDSFSGSVDTYSVGLDTNGYFDVFVVIGHTTLGNLGSNTGQLQEYDPSQGGWKPIINTYGEVTALTTLSATSGGECFVSGGGVMWEYRPNSSGSGGFISTDYRSGFADPIMDFSAAGADNVMALDIDHTVWRYFGFSSYFNGYLWEPWG